MIKFLERSRLRDVDILRNVSISDDFITQSFISDILPSARNPTHKHIPSI